MNIDEKIASKGRHIKELKIFLDREENEFLMVVIAGSHISPRTLLKSGYWSISC